MAVLPYAYPQQKDPNWHPPMALSNAAPPFPEVGAQSAPPAQLGSAPAPVAAKSAPMPPKKDATSAYKAPDVNAGQKQVAQAAYYGIGAAGGVPMTPDPAEAAVGVAGAVAQGTAAGFFAGGPAGAVAGGGLALVLGGLNAFMGNRAARKERDHAAALQAEADKRAREEMAQVEKWRIINRLDNLEQAKYERNKYAMQQAYQVSQNQGKSMMALIESNAQLKDRFAKFGY